MNPCTRCWGESEQHAKGGRHQDLRRQHGEILQTLARRLPHRHGIGGRRGLKPYAQKDHLARGIGARNLQRVHG